MQLKKTSGVGKIKMKYWPAGNKVKVCRLAGVEGFESAWQIKNRFAYRHFSTQPKNQGHARSNPTSLSKIKQPDAWSD